MKIIIFSLLLVTSFRVHAEWQNSGEVGMTATTGNVSSSTYNAAYSAAYLWDANKIKAAARFISSRSNNVESARNWDANFRYERALSDYFSVYGAHILESDVYSGYIQRNNYEAGGKYALIKSESTNWFVELGYRNAFTMYVGSPSAVSNYVRTYTEASQAISQAATVRFWIEYLPSFTDSNDWLLNLEPSLSTALTKAFSLKTAYLYKYHNILPAGFRSQSDGYFTLSFVAVL